ncbi:DNA polymerase III subunit delta' [Chelativorans salis]|uniref:DNA polymerase III subunit delta n=1 Tax=Chelativorans salis TaxID=2978478 RepID=A0ABT2LLC9_9HYPH|nr:DNA polymerase III subunit delta' [Chelativorans sp. EGI FJ00035]MCT7375395.1 DNA polymerase III subunit delta' [Chelativorans sp. EGI FJ00035]
MFERVAPEQHDTLPDIPEPAENPLLVGHEEARTMLAGAYRAGKLHHALLLAGPRGTGKATLAFHLAHHLFTHPKSEEAPQIFGEADARSQAFRLAAQGAHPGLLHLTRPYGEREKKFKTVITVDEIRRVSRFLSMTASDGGYRVVIVDPADDMNTSAANALLKNLEEPPSRTLFVLIAHSPGRLLPTIRSRCQVIKLQPLGAGSLEELLQRLGADLPESAEERRLLVERAGGSVRNAVLLTQFGGLEIAQAIERVAGGSRFDVSETYRLAEAVAARDAQVQFDIFNRTVLSRVAGAATRAAEAGDAARAARMAASWEEMAETVRQAEIFNLERKQHVVGLMRRLREAEHGMPPN